MYNIWFHYREIDAFIYDASLLEYKVAQDDFCKLRTVGSIYAMTGYGLALPKASKWYKPINDYLLDYQKNGYFYIVKLCVSL